MDKYQTKNKEKIIEPLNIDRVLSMKEFEEKLNQWALGNFGVKGSVFTKEVTTTLKNKITKTERKEEMTKPITTLSDKITTTTETTNKTINYDLILKEHLKTLDNSYFEITGDKPKRVNNY